MGDSAQITASATAGEVRYSTSDSSVATVSDAGVVTGIAPGQVTITVTAAETENYLAASKEFTVMVEEAVSPDEPTIRTGSVRGLPGQTVEVTVSLENNPGIVSMLLDVSYDNEVLTLVGVEDAGILGTTDHGKSYSMVPYSLSWTNDTATENYEVNGTVVTLKFAIAEDAPEGVYPVEITYDETKDPIFDKDIKTVDFAVQPGGVKVTTVIPGDVNGDGKVTAIDRACLARHLAGWEGYSAEDLVAAAMDVNADGKVTAIDRAILARHLAGWDGYERLPYIK